MLLRGHWLLSLEIKSSQNQLIGILRVVETIKTSGADVVNYQTVLCCILRLCGVSDGEASELSLMIRKFLIKGIQDEQTSDTVVQRASGVQVMHTTE